MKWLGLALVCGCTQIYGLDSTEVGGAPPDLDGDGALDGVDNCPGVANPMQEDRDGDGFGDVCDLCPDLSTASNHDEDTDTRGDACDLCPAAPDFQMDTDKDGVGDACDNDFAAQNTRLLFDSFQTLGPQWVQSGTWSLLGDAVAPSAPGGTLHAPMVEVVGRDSDAFEVLLGLTQTGPLAAGDQLEIQIVDAGGSVIVGCRVRCDASLGCVLSDLTGMSSEQVPANRPLDTLAFRRNAYGQYCSYSTGSTAIPPVLFAKGSVRLLGTPKIQFRYLSVTQ